MGRKLLTVFLILAITLCSLTITAVAAPAIATGTLTLSTSSAAAGDTVTASGISVPDTWVAVKVLDSSGSIVFYDNVKSDMTGAYSCAFKVPYGADGSLQVIVGYGSNVVSASLNVTQPVNSATYTVIFKDWDGSILKTETVNEGDGATAPANPTRTSYTFTGWDKAFSSVTSDLTVTAQYSYNKSSGGGGSSSTSGGSTSPATQTYNADVSAGNGSDSTLPVTVDKNSSSAGVDISSGNSLMSNGKTTVITAPTVPDVDSYTLGIPVPSLSTPYAQGNLALNTDVGKVTVPSNMLTGVTGISGSKAAITIGQGDKSNLSDEQKVAIGNRPLVQLTLSIDGKQTKWNNSDAPVTVSIPYTPTAEELKNPECIVIWYIDGSGKAVSIPNGHYDSASGNVTFTTTHFSYYAVGYNQVSFKDISSDAWYSKAVSFVAARGITTGTGEGNYSPDVKLTRGQLLTMVMRAYGISPDENPKDNFADAGNTFYSGYLAAAKRLGITAGIGNNTFAPEKEITRQEMFTLLYNILKQLGELPTMVTGKTMTSYSDSNEVASWAKDALTLFVGTGTVSGNGGNLNPAGTTDRAQIAQVLYNLLSK